MSSVPSPQPLSIEVDQSGDGPRTVWLASYPKSGNTWMRAIVTALTADVRLFGFNRLSSGAQPYVVDAATRRYGIDPRWLCRTEIARLRAELIRDTDRRCWAADHESDDVDSRQSTGAGDGLEDASDIAMLPQLRKTHECYRFEASGSEPFPADATRAAILIVRDPRDVVCSYAPFFGVDLDQAVEALGRRVGGEVASPATLRTAQPWGTWSAHGRSWLDPQVPFPVHLVRYEDLRADTVATLLPVFNSIGLECDRAMLTAAVEHTAFERLQAAEAGQRFRESSRRAPSFFRQGRSGGWRTELSPEQVAALEADHGEMMERFGYELTTDVVARRSLAEARASRRRQQGRDWYQLPEHLGLEVSTGEVPAELVDAVHPTPWLQLGDRVARIEVGSVAAMLVEDGRKVTVQWNGSTESEAGDDAAGDVAGADGDVAGAGDVSDGRGLEHDRSWVVQGWAVAVATMQRGQLCLHASTVEVGDQIVAIAGRRGAGKSTTSMGLRRRGHRLLVDDTSVLDFRSDGVWMQPYARNVHLLPDTAEALGVDFAALTPLAGRAIKSSFLAEETSTEPRQLDRIVVLQPSSQLVEPTIVEVHGAARMRVLRNQVHRRGLAPMLLGPERFFERLAQLADATRVQVLRRPAEGWSLDEVLDLIERTE
jgi:aryl sulfotransferase